MYLIKLLFISLMLLSSLNWLELNKDTVVLCKVAYSWIYELYGYWTELNQQLNSYELNNETIVFLEVLYTKIWIRLIFDKVCIIDSVIFLFVTINCFETACIM